MNYIKAEKEQSWDGTLANKIKQHFHITTLYTLMLENNILVMKHYNAVVYHIPCQQIHFDSNLTNAMH